MNRLLAGSDYSLLSQSSAACAERPAARGGARMTQAQCVLAPLHYEPNYAYPLVVWLHGSGGDERELKRVMPLISLRNYVSVAAAGPTKASHGYDWPQTEEGIQAASARVDEAVAQACQRFHVNSERVFLAGYGSGGTMAVRLALRQPGCFAGAASLGGAFPKGHAPLSQLAKARQVPLLIAHSRDSQTYRVEYLCQELALFHAAGMRITLRQYPCGDELTTQMLHDANAWLMEQVTGIPVEEQEGTPLPSDWN